MFGKELFSARRNAGRWSDAGPLRVASQHVRSARRSRASRIAAAAAAVSLVGGLTVTSVGSLGVASANTVGQGFTVTPADLDFILQQIKIAEAHVANTTEATGPCGALVGPGPDQIPSPLLSFGLRTVDGSCNNLQPGQETFGAADQTFPRLTTPVFGPAEANPPLFGPPAATSYAQTSGNVFDSEPRTISNLIVDQTSTNPAAVAAAGFPVRSQGNEGVVPCETVPGSDPPIDIDPPTPVDCVPQYQTLFIPNVTTDVGLSPPFNGLFTIFGQFFDHGLDKITNGGNGAVFVPLKADDPLVAGDNHIFGDADDLPANQRFMVVTRGHIVTGADGFRNAPNTDTPFIDQSQTYTSHSSHQVFLREYVNNTLDRPVATGKFLSSADGGLATWAMIKAQAATLLGLELVDADVANIPMIAADVYGKFIPGPLHGLPQFVTPGGLVEGDRDAPVAAAAVGAFRIDTAFLNDIAHSAAPTPGGPDFVPEAPGPDGILLDDPSTFAGGNESADNTPAVPADPGPDGLFGTDCDTATPSPECAGDTPAVPEGPGPDGILLDDPATTVGGDESADNIAAHDDGVAGGSLDTPVPTGTYDDELLDLHFICGDGRCNENIALTAVHQVFHAEHDRLIGYIQNVLATDTSGITSLADWQSALGADGWNGERLFQAARFVTEMEYQHLVFEEFARKVQPGINPFEPFAFNQTDVDPAITAEFAHAVYRFGHSMLTEDIARINADGSRNDIPLFDGFLNPAEYYNGGTAGTLTSEEAAGSIIMGMSDQVGNEIDEFVTDVLRNHLVGLPLDLPAINMTRARSEGIPSLNNVRKQIFNATNDGQLTPYTDWVDFGQALKHPESLVNFIAAYGTHPTITSQTSLAGKRAAADQIVNGTVLPGPNGLLGTDCGTITASPECDDNILPPADSADFMFSTGFDVGTTGEDWTNTSGGVSITGVDDIDLWVGGLAEHTNLFGGLLGSTFNYVFENQLTNLQNGDRFYYLARTPGMNLRAQLEGNSFAELVMRNTNAHTLKADPFATADCKFEISNLTWPATSVGSSGRLITGVGSIQDDPLSECDENEQLLRMSNGTIRYRLINTAMPSGINAQAVYNGTVDKPATLVDESLTVDRIFGGADNDTFWGGPGNDIIEGGDGADIALGGEGNDIITDLAGDDVPKGGPGNDAIDGGPGLDILMGAEGNDFMNGGANSNETFGGEGNDFVIAGQGMDAVFGDSGDDWIQGGDMPDLLIGDSSTLFFDDHNVPGHDVTIGQGGDDDYDTEGGDDILVAGPGVEKNAGTAGYDWSIGLADPQPQFADLNLKILPEGQPAIEVRDRFNEVEALSGWNLDDQLFGDDLVPSAIGGGGFIGCDALDQDGLDRIAGLDALVPPLTVPSAPIEAAATTRYCGLVGNVWGEGNILLGGGGSDTIEGRGADDIIDGDKYMNVRLSIRTNADGTGPEIASSSLMETIPTGPGWTGALAGKTLQQAVFAGLIDPGRIVIVREILSPASTIGNVDTALFSGPELNYTVTPNGNGSVTVTDNVGTDGVDTLWNMEQASFCDVTDAAGRCISSTIVSLTNFPVPGVSVASLAFAPRAIAAGPSTLPITVSNAGGGTLNITSFSVTGTDAALFAATSNCTTLTGLATCNFTVAFDPVVAGSFTAQLNIVTNAGTVVVPLTGTGVVNTPATGAPTISDTTPTEGALLTATTAGVADVDGVAGVFSFQWRQSLTPAGAVNTVIAGATSPTFTPGALQVNRRLTVTVSFVDNAGTLEARTSAITIVVGDLFTGGAGVDVQVGTAGQDEYHGAGGNDNLSTAGEDDLVSGDAGDDTISTAGGDDTITFNGAGEGFDAVTGGAGGDQIIALSNGTVIGLRSLSTVESISANGFTGVTILGSPNNDVLNFTAVTLTGIVSIDGGGGNDALTGSAAADLIIGRAGTDTINGGLGVDTIEGGANNDTMNGGLGNDFFRYNPGGFGADTITGFDANPGGGGQDLINLTGLGITAGTFAANVTIADGGGGATLITIAGQGTIRLTGVVFTNVDISDFILA